MIPKPDKQLKNKIKEVKFGGSNVRDWEEEGGVLTVAMSHFLTSWWACCAVIIHSS